MKVIKASMFQDSRGEQKTSSKRVFAFISFAVAIVIAGISLFVDVAGNGVALVGMFLGATTAVLGVSTFEKQAGK